MRAALRPQRKKDRKRRLREPQQILRGFVRNGDAVHEQTREQRKDVCDAQRHGELDDAAGDTGMRAFQALHHREQRELPDGKPRPQFEERAFGSRVRQNSGLQECVCYKGAAERSQYGERTLQSRREPRMMRIDQAAPAEQISQAVPNQRGGHDRGNPERKRAFHDRCEFVVPNAPSSKCYQCAMNHSIFGSDEPLGFPLPTRIQTTVCELSAICVGSPVYSAYVLDPV